MRHWLLVVTGGLAASCAGHGSPVVVPAASTAPSTAVATTTTAPSIAPPTNSLDEQVARLRAVFGTIQADGPGCSAAISEEGTLVWAEGFGLADLETGAPITTETPFDIGSTSKQFTATAVLLLADDGVLSVDAPIRSILGELPAWGDEVTVAQMMHHVSGIPEYITLFLDAGVDFTDRTTKADALQALTQVTELDFEPGSHAEYSNSNYFLLGLIVERVSGSELSEFLDTRVFGPLALDAVMDQVGAIPGKARSYAKDGDAWSPDTFTWEQVGAGAIQTTPTDLVHWASQYWEPTLGGPDLLAARTAGAVEFGDGASYGAGIVVEAGPNGSPMYSHGGSIVSFRSELAIRPNEQLAAAVTCNGAYSDAQPDPRLLARQLLDLWSTR